MKLSWANKLEKKNVVLEKQLNITQEKYKEVKRLSENFDEILKRKESEMQENVGKAISSEVERTLSNNINEVKELKEHVKTLKENEDVYKKTIEDLGTKEKSKSDEYQALTEKYNTFEVTMLQKIAKENEDNSKHIEQLNLEITNLQREMSNRDIHAIEKSLENEKSTGKYQLLEEQLDNLKKTLESTRQELQDTQEKFNRKSKNWKWKKSDIKRLANEDVIKYQNQIKDLQNQLEVTKKKNLEKSLDEVKVQLDDEKTHTLKKIATIEENNNMDMLKLTNRINSLEIELEEEKKVAVQKIKENSKIYDLKNVVNARNLETSKLKIKELEEKITDLESMSSYNKEDVSKQLAQLQTNNTILQSEIDELSKKKQRITTKIYWWINYNKQ